MIRVISGDNELQALDFQKHYRTPAVYLMDPTRSFERHYNRNGWPFLMLVNEEGNILYSCNNLVNNDTSFMKQLKEITAEKRRAPIRPIGEIPYLQATLNNNHESDNIRSDERFTSIACGLDDTLYTVYTAVENGNSNVYLQVRQNNGSSEILPVAAGQADEYDATVTVDAHGGIWVCWTSNQRGGTYNIYLTDLNGIRNNRSPVLISQSKEDAMHGRLASDTSSRIWVTYYQWEKMNGMSRDKEVYLRHYNNGSVSDEIHVSPQDVPAYEDHTDPGIAIVNDRPLVCWSWDFHKPKGYPQQAQSPTIFARWIPADGPGAKPFCISEKAIDMTPAIGICDDSIWCAWDALGGHRKSLCARAITTGDTSGKIQVIADELSNVCSPTFAFYNDTDGVLMWSQTQNGRDWSLWKADYDKQHKKWKNASEIVSDQNPRFGSCTYDSQGRLWMAYSVEMQNGRKVKVQCHGNRTDH